MGSVAAAMSERGFTVTGSDENVYPPMSTFLEERNVALFSGYSAENIPAKADVVVIGNAIKRGNPEGEAVLNRKLFYLSLPEVLKNYFLRGRHNLVVTGTHGKTTTTALLAWTMESAKRNAMESRSQSRRVMRASRMKMGKIGRMYRGEQGRKLLQKTIIQLSARYSA